MSLLNPVLLAFWFLGMIALFMSFWSFGLFNRANISAVILKVLLIPFWPVMFIVSNIVSAFFPQLIKKINLEGFQPIIKEDIKTPKNSLQDQVQELDKNLENAEIFIFKSIITEEDPTVFHYRIINESKYLEDMSREDTKCRE